MCRLFEQAFVRKCHSANLEPSLWNDWIYAAFLQGLVFVRYLVQSEGYINECFIRNMLFGTIIIKKMKHMISGLPLIFIYRGIKNVALCRLDCPFEELLAFSNETDFDSMEKDGDFKKHSHTPYVLIYFKLLAKWRQSLVENGQMSRSDADKAFPAITRVRRQFEQFIEDMRMVHPEGKNIVEGNFDEAKVNLFKSFQKTEVCIFTLKLSILSFNKIKQP
jgi:hypothetical protein